MEGEAARLRNLLALNAVSKSHELKQIWIQDPHETVQQRGGVENPVTNLFEYCEMAAKENYYADGWLLQALAFESSKKTWSFGNMMNSHGKGILLKASLKENKETPWRPLACV